MHGRSILTWRDLVTSINIWWYCFYFTGFLNIWISFAFVIPLNCHSRSLSKTSSCSKHMQCLSISVSLCSVYETLQDLKEVHHTQNSHINKYTNGNLKTRVHNLHWPVYKWQFEDTCTQLTLASIQMAIWRHVYTTYIGQFLDGTLRVLDEAHIDGPVLPLTKPLVDTEAIRGLRKLLVRIVWHDPKGHGHLALLVAELWHVRRVCPILDHGSDTLQRSHARGGRAHVALQKENNNYHMNYE